MNQYEVRVHKINALIAAEIASMHAMLAINLHRTSNGHSAAYDDSHFFSLQNRIEGHAKDLEKLESLV
jgi:hypothetical protein